MDMAKVKQSNAKSLSCVEQAGVQPARDEDFAEVKERRCKKDQRWSEEEEQKERQFRCWQMPEIDGKGHSVRAKEESI